MATILVVDDEEKMRHLLAIILEREGHRVDNAGDGVQALEKLSDGSYDMVITDMKMPRMDGSTLLMEIRRRNLPCPVVFITAFATVDSAVDAMRLGAADYITKPFETDRIMLTVARTLNVSRMMIENRDLKTALRQTQEPETIVHVSGGMKAIMDLADRVAESDSAVLVSGESGTGKELLARFVHYKSTRSGRRFVPVNCAAISPHLVESELFGHEKGAFTGADRRKIGKFEYASTGTLFLDEIGDLPSEAQAKLLRALQEKKIQRVGGNEEIPVDVRVICATNRNLQAMVDSGTFRRDLYFRINVFPIHLPPLRERPEDVEPLARYFLNRLGRKTDRDLSPDALRTLNGYGWPGNVRELANAMERAVILTGPNHIITAETLSFLKSPEPAPCSRQGTFTLPSEGVSLEAVERDWVRQAMEMAGGNQSVAAGLLGLTRAKFRVLLKHVEE